MIDIERLRELFTLDHETGRLTWRETVNSNAIAGTEAGNTHTFGYRRIQIDGVSYFAHRIVYAMVNGEWPAKYVDHINGDRADNRPCNLRQATSAQNVRNSKIRSTNKSGVKGVSWRADRGKWWAQIVVDGQTIRLGYFNDIQAAADAYKEAAAKYHGEFVRAA